MLELAQCSFLLQNCLGDLLNQVLVRVCTVGYTDETNTILLQYLAYNS